MDTYFEAIMVAVATGLTSTICTLLGTWKLIMWRVARLEKDLYDNGQPGFITKTYDRLRVIDHKLDKVENNCRHYHEDKEPAA